MNKPKVLLTFLLCISFVAVMAQNRNQAYLNYIQQYADEAMASQRNYGIPASIKLAQGLLESGAGQSELARKSNNHFGIKCHNWSGQTTTHDDDARGECFRKYNTVLESYNDHSDFLRTRTRYANLFDLSPTDFKGWAHGLKRAGYATDPSYAFKLINIIELYELHKYDLQAGNSKPGNNNIAQSGVVVQGATNANMGTLQAARKHQVFKNKGIRFVVSEAGDTYASIADEFNKSDRRIRQYNDVDLHSVLAPGMQVYIQAKRNRAPKGNDVHVVKANETMYSIAQTYAIKLEKLYVMNNMPFTSGPQVGQVLLLR